MGEVVSAWAIHPIHEVGESRHMSYDGKNKHRLE